MVLKLDDRRVGARLVAKKGIDLPVLAEHRPQLFIRRLGRKEEGDMSPRMPQLMHIIAGHIVHTSAGMFRICTVSVGSLSK
jgi:hypothetical protein